MLTMKIGTSKMLNQHSIKRILLYVLALVSLVVTVFFILQQYSDLIVPSTDHSGRSAQMQKTSSKVSVGSCVFMKTCPEDQFSVFVQSGAANIVAPKMCLEHKLVLGTVLSNVGFGINILVLSGKTGDVIKTGNFNTYDGDIQPLIDFLRTIEKGTAVLIATYDEPSKKLNDEARKLIGELGSSVIQSLGFRDNWVFIGGKGAQNNSTLEKRIKYSTENDKYDGWPEIISLEGCIPKYQE